MKGLTYLSKTAFPFLCAAFLCIPFLATAQGVVTWTNVTGATYSSDTVKKNVTGSFGNSGAASVNILAPDSSGWVEFYKNSCSAGSFMMGFSKLDLDQNYTSMGYAAWYDGSGIQIYESGNWKGNFGTFSTGDTFRVERSGISILYKKNGTTLRTVTCNAHDRLLVDLSIASNTNFVSNVRTSLPLSLRIDPSVTDVLPPSTSNGGISLTVSGGTSPYTYSWSTGATTSSISSLSAGTYTVTVTDNTSATATASVAVGYQLLWENIKAASNTGNSITNTGTGGTYTHGASSKNYTAPGANGYLEHTVTSGTSAYAVGLINQYFDSTAASMTYSFLKNGAGVSIYESNASVAGPWTVGVGDVLRIERMNDTIKYSLNGTLLRAVKTDFTGRLMVDASIASTSGSIAMIKTNIGLPYGVRAMVTDQNPATASSGAIALEVLGGKTPYTYAWSGGATTQNRSGLNAGTYTVTVTDSSSTTVSASIEVGYQVAWENTSGVTVTGNSLVSSLTSYTGGAASKNYIAAGQDGYVSCVVQNLSDQFVFGLSTQDMDLLPATIGFGYWKRANGGSVRNGETTPTGVTDWPIKIGDTLRIERNGSNIRWLQNGTVRRTQATDQLGRLVVDVSMGFNSPKMLRIKTNMGVPFSVRTGAVTDQDPSSTGTGAVSIDVLGGVSPYTYVWSNGATTKDIIALNKGTYSVTVTDAGSATCTGTFRVGYQVLWQNVVSATTTANSLSFSTTSFTGGASSRNYLKPYENGYFRYIVSNIASSNIGFGLSEKDTTVNPNAILYNITPVYSTPSVLIYEKGTNITGITNNLLIVGDTLKLERNGDSVYYWKNSYLLRRVFTNKAKPMLADISFGTGGAIKYVKTDFGNAADSSNLYWTGFQDSLWNNANNWSFTPGGSAPAVVPDSNRTVYFNQYRTRNCYLNANTTVKAVQVDSGATVNLQSYTLTSKHNWLQNNGSVNGAAATLSIKDTLILKGGTFNAPATLNLYGDFTDTLNIFHHNSGTVMLKASVNVMTTDTFYNLTVADSGTISMRKALIVANHLVLGQRSRFDLNGHGLQLNNSHANSLSFGSHGGLIANDNHFYSYLSWKMANDTGLFKIPLMLPNGDSVPVSYRVQVSGTGSNGSIAFSTYALTSFQSSIVYPHSAPIGPVFDTAVIAYPHYSMPRYWLLDAYNYTAAPRGKVTLAYTANDLAHNADVKEARLVANRWNGTSWSQLHGTVDTALHTFTIDSLQGAINLLSLSDSITTVLPPASPSGQASCSDTAVTFTISGIAAGIHGNQIEWATNGTFTGSNILSSPATITVTVPSAISATIWIRSRNSVMGGVSSAITASAAVHALPVVTILPNDTLVLQGQAVTLTASGGGTYIWPSLPSSSASVSITPSADSAYYAVMVTDTAGCTNRDSALVRVIGTPIVSVSSNRDTINSGDSTDIIIAYKNAGTSVIWSRDNGSNVTGLQNGTGFLIKEPLENNTLAFQTVNYWIEGRVGPYSAIPKSVPVVVRPSAFPITSTLDITPIPPQFLVACADSTFRFAIVSTDSNVFSVRLVLAYPPSPSSVSIDDSTHFSSSVSSDTILINSVGKFKGNDTLALSFKIPCSVIPDSTSNYSYNTGVAMDVLNASGSVFVGSSWSSQLTLKFPYLAPSTLNVLTDTLKYRNPSAVAAIFGNAASSDFSGSVVLDTVFGCDSNIRVVDSVAFVVDGMVDTVLYRPSFPIRIPHISVPAGKSLTILELDSIVSCIPKPQGCLDRFILHWGCNITEVCKVDSITKSLKHSKDSANIVVSRVLPVAISGDSREAEWDASCTGNTTQWEYVIENIGTLPDTNTVIRLAVPSFASMYTYILKGSIHLEVDSIFFPNPSSAPIIVPAIKTPKFTPLLSGEFTNNGLQPSICFDSLIAHHDTVIKSFIDTVPALQPGQRVVFRFQTYRCCPSDNPFNSAVSFNNWKLLVNGSNECGEDLKGHTDPDHKEYISANGHDTTLTFIKSEGSDDEISADHNAFPNLEMSQKLPTNPENPLYLSGLKSGCGPIERFRVINYSFLNNTHSQPNYNPQLFCATGSVSGGNVTGLDMRGQFKVQFRCENFLKIDTFSKPTIGNFGATWNCTNSVTSVNDTLVTVYFDFDDLPTQAHTNSDSLINFLVGSNLSFGLSACCPFTGNPFKNVMASTYFNPNAKTGCETCWIPLSQINFSVEIHCPGCKTPGIITVDSFTRVNYGYQDANNDGLPDSNRLLAIDSAYSASHPVESTRAIVGDTLMTVSYSYFQDGDSAEPGGFTYDNWISYWTHVWDSLGILVDPPRLAHLYIEHQISNSSKLGIKCFNAVIEYHDSTGIYSHTLVSPSSPIVANDSNIFLFDVVDSQFRAGARFGNGNYTKLTQYYTICKNTDSLTALTFTNRTYMSFDTMTGLRPSTRYKLATDPIWNGLPDHNPNHPLLYYCDEFSRNNGNVYPVFKRISVESTNSGTCQHSYAIHLSAFISEATSWINYYRAYTNIFKNEYRMVPGVFDSVGPLLSNGYPLTLSFRVPHDYAAKVNYMHTTALTLNGLNTTSYIRSEIGQNIIDTLIEPIDSVVGLDTIYSYVNLKKVIYSPPFAALGFIPGPNDGQHNFIHSKPALAIGDEYFEQEFNVSLYSRCDVVSQHDILSPGGISVLYPGFGCQNIGQDELVNAPPAGNACNCYEIQVPSQPPYVVTVTDLQYLGSNIKWTVNLTDTSSHSTVPVNMFLFIPDTTASRLGMDTVRGGATGSCNTLLPYTVISGYRRYSLIGASPFCIGAKIKECNTVLNIPFSFSWSCDGLPSLLPPSTNFCFTPQSVTLSANLPSVNLAPIPVNPPAHAYKTCDSIPYRACVRNAIPLGIGNFIDTLVLPTNVRLDASRVFLNDSLPGHSIQIHPDSLHGTNTWVFDTRHLTALDTASFLFGPNGLHGTDSMCVSFNLYAKCNDAEIPALDFNFTGISYCGDAVSKTCKFNPLLISGNGCGPYVSISKVDTSCVLGSVKVDSVWGGTAPYTYVWNTVPAQTDTFIDSLQSGHTYMVTVTDTHTGCYVTDSIKISFTDGIAVGLTQTAACSPPHNIISTVTNAAGSVIYEWSNLANTPSIYNVSAGPYTLTVTDTSGCKANASALVLPDPIGVSIVGPTLNCDTGYVTYRVANPITTAIYTWTISGGINGSPLQGDSVRIKWTSWPDTVRVMGVYPRCADTVISILAIDTCSCAPPAGNVYVLSNINLSQVRQGSGTGTAYQMLPFVSIAGGDSVDNVAIFISGTLTLDTDLVITSSPHVYMAPGARILVLNNHRLTLLGSGGDTTTLQAACNALWRGIQLQPLASLIMNLAMVRDADTAVYAHAGGNIVLTNSFFTQDYKGVVIDSVTNSTAYPLVMDGVHFYNRYAPLLAPRTTQYRCNVGIEVNRVKNIYIGNDTLAQNVFHSMDTAINLINSGVTVRNQFISGDSTGGYFTTVLGIGARDNQTQANPVFIGTAPGTDSTVTLYLCDYGIQAKNFFRSALEVCNCNVVNRLETNVNRLVQGWHMIGTGISATNFTPVQAAAPRRIHIHYNRINKGSIGIMATSNQTGISVHDNIIDLSQNVESDISWGIRISNYSTVYNFNAATFNMGDTVYDNTIAAGTGIICDQRNRQTISNNTVTSRGLGFTGDKYGGGILQSGCAASHVSCNDVTGFRNTLDDGQRGNIGIGTWLANGSLFQCNQVNHLDVGMAANGPQILTMKNNRLGVDTCMVGFAVINNGSVGPQGTVDSSYDNEWRGYHRTSGVKTYSSIGGLSPFFVRTSTNFIPTNSSGSQIPINLITPSYSAVSCTTLGCSPNILALVVSHSYARSILADTIPYPNDSVLYRDWSRFNLYSALQYADTSLLNDTIISNFFDTYHSSTIGHLLDRRVQMDTLDLSDYSTYSSLHSAINSISTRSDFEANLKSYALVYLQSQHYGMNSELTGAVNDLANQCLFYGGPAVLEARALLGADSLKYIGYRWQDSCVTGSGKRGKDEKPQVITNIKPQLDYKLIPNLYKDNFMAHLTLNADEQGEIQIYNVAGGLMGRHKVIAGENDINLSSDGLQAGIYFYKVYVNGELKTNDKLVVVH